DLLRVIRWEVAGGVWQVLSHSERSALVSLCRCDAGEEVERFTSTDPALLAHLAGRARSDDV
ncbi:MAG: hypothetical protein ABIS35_13330, partial [Terracoccus sp.]